MTVQQISALLLRLACDVGDVGDQLEAETLTVGDALLLDAPARHLAIEISRLERLIGPVLEAA